MQSPEHREPKEEIPRLLFGLGYPFSLVEYQHSDVVACGKVGNLPIKLGAEYERSARNAVRNIQRNIGNGCRAVLVVCEDMDVLAAVANKLRRHLPKQFWGSVGVITIQTLRLLQP